MYYQTDAQVVDPRKAELALSLGVLLSSAYVFLVKTAGNHWNVKGPDFSEYHKFFEEIYEDVDGSIDPLAENILKLGFDAPASLSEFLAMSVVPDGSMCATDDCMQMCRELLVANELVITQIADAFEIANAINEQGIADFLAGREDMHKKWSWQLRACCGLQVGGKLNAIVKGL
jgi:starvation-inducible DNA-binding protein